MQPSSTACPYPSPYPHTYHAHTPEHQDWLLWWLDQLEIPFSELDEWGWAMAGKPPSFFGVLARKHQRHLQLSKPSEIARPVELPTSSCGLWAAWTPPHRRLGSHP